MQWYITEKNTVCHFRPMGLEIHVPLCMCLHVSHLTHLHLLHDFDIFGIPRISSYATVVHSWKHRPVMPSQFRPKGGFLSRKWASSHNKCPLLLMWGLKRTGACVPGTKVHYGFNARTIHHGNIFSSKLCPTCAGVPEICFISETTKNARC